MRVGKAGSTPSGSKIDAVEGLRALAALSVLGYHVAAYTGHSQHNAAASQLKAGVAVFFVISGLVLYRPYARAIAGGSRLPDWRRFIRRRVFRILPAYWVVLTIWLVINVLTAPHNGAFGASGGWWRYYTLTQTYVGQPDGGGLAVAWSLCVEFAFYLTLPVLAYALARSSQRARRRAGRSAAGIQLAAIALLALCSFELRLSLTGSLFARVPTRGLVAATSLPLLFDWFAAGIVLAVLAAEWELRPERFPALRRLAGRADVCWLGGLMLFIAAVPIQGGDLNLQLDSAGAHLAIGLGSALLVLPMVRPAVSRSRLLSALGSPRMVWLGTISYGIYLVHLPVLFELRALLLGIPAYHPVGSVGAASTAALLMATVIVTICLAALSWYVIERPAQQLSRSLGRRSDLQPLAHEQLEPMVPSTAHAADLHPGDTDGLEFT